MKLLSIVIVCCIIASPNLSGMYQQPVKTNGIQKLKTGQTTLLSRVQNDKEVHVTKEKKSNEAIFMGIEIMYRDKIYDGEVHLYDNEARKNWRTLKRSFNGKNFNQE